MKYFLDSSHLFGMTQKNELLRSSWSWAATKGSRLMDFLFF